MCSSVWSRLSPVFSWKFGCHLYPLHHDRDSTLKKTFRSKVFFEKWNDTEKPKKKTEKRDSAKDKWYNQMGQVGTSWSRGTSGTRTRGCAAATELAVGAGWHALLLSRAGSIAAHGVTEVPWLEELHPFDVLSHIFTTHNKTHGKSRDFPIAQIHLHKVSTTDAVVLWEHGQGG